MGSSASLGVAAAVRAAEPAELQAAFALLPAGSRQRLMGAACAGQAARAPAEEACGVGPAVEDAEQRKLLERALEALALDVRDAPSCMGSPSFKVMRDRMRRYLDALIDLQDSEALEAFRSFMASRESSTVVEPYSDPDDRYEAMANDYGSDLQDYYRKGRQEAGTALAAVRKAVEEGKPPAIWKEDLEAFKKERAEEEAARTRKAEGARQAAEAEWEARLRQREAVVAKIVDCLKSLQGAVRSASEDEPAALANSPLGTARTSLHQVLDECESESSAWTEQPAFSAEIGPTVLSRSADVPAPLLAAFVEHRLCRASSQLADHFWRMCQSSPVVDIGEAPLRRALALRLSEEVDAAAEGERACVEGSNGNALLLWACYKGNLGAVTSLMDAYREGLDKEALTLRLQTQLLNKDGLNALHMAARVSGHGRQHCLEICEKLAPFVDPSRKSKEGKDVLDYLKMNQRQGVIDQFTQALRSQGWFLST